MRSFIAITIVTLPPTALVEVLGEMIDCAVGMSPQSVCKTNTALTQVLSDAAPWQNLLLSDFTEQLQVLAHGVHAVRRHEQAFGFTGENGRNLGNVGAQKTLHELLH